MGVYSDFDSSSPRFFAFNMNTLLAFLLTLALEVVEDVIVHNELIPFAPTLTLEAESYAAMEADDVHQMLGITTVSSSTDEADPDVWRTSAIAKKSGDLNAADTKLVQGISFPSRDPSRSDNVRSKLGQPRCM